jgi:hypothetical protein
LFAVVPASDSGRAVPVITFLHADRLGRAGADAATSTRTATVASETETRMRAKIEAPPVARAG